MRSYRPIRGLTMFAHQLSFRCKTGSGIRSMNAINNHKNDSNKRHELDAFERGHITVMMAAVISIAIMLIGIVATIGSIGVSHARADNAADFGALAAAATKYGLNSFSGQPCEAARVTVEQNGAHMESCTAFGADYRIVVRIDTVGVQFLPAIYGYARAGPQN